MYLLQPGGQPPIPEYGYEGYGHFGDIDAHLWLARKNVPNADALNRDTLVSLGIGLDVGRAFIDTETDTIWSVFHDHRLLIGGKFFAGTFNEVIAELGMSGNEAMKQRRLYQVPVKQLAMLRYPLKFSFNPNAVYESLPAAKICETQGFFEE